MDNESQSQPENAHESQDDDFTQEARQVKDDTDMHTASAPANEQHSRCDEELATADAVAASHTEQARKENPQANGQGEQQRRPIEGEHSEHPKEDSEDRNSPSLTSGSFSGSSLSDEEAEPGECARIVYIARKLFRWVCRNCCEVNEYKLTEEALSYAKMVLEYFEVTREKRQREGLEMETTDNIDEEQCPNNPAFLPARPSLASDQDRCKSCHSLRCNMDPEDVGALASITTGSEISNKLREIIKTHMYAKGIPDIPKITAVPYLDNNSRTYVSFPTDTEKQTDDTVAFSLQQSEPNCGKDNGNSCNGSSSKHAGLGKGLSSLSKLGVRDENSSDSDSSEDDHDSETSTFGRDEMCDALKHQWKNNCLKPVSQSFIQGFGSFTPVCALAYNGDMCEHFSPEDDENRFCADISFPSTTHPERPDRIRAIAAHLITQGLFQRCWRIPIRKAKRSELLLTHSEILYETIKQTSKGNDGDNMPLDTYVNEGTFKASKISCGGVISVMEKILNRQASNGLAIVRPPGHHAECSHSMGFCIFNNVAVAAAVAKSKWGVRRILILDWDVHHGNGTQNMFLQDPEVLYMSIHRFDNGSFFPGTGPVSEVGSGSGEGYTVNIPWPSKGMGDAEYMSAFDQVVLPIARQFSPELVLVSAGFDAAKGDPLGGCNVSPACYAHMTSMLKTLAGGRLIVALEGGYNLRSISRSTEAVVRVLLGDTPPPLDHPRSARNTTSVDSPSGCYNALSPSMDGVERLMEHVATYDSSQRSAQASPEPGLSAPETAAAWTISRVVKTQSAYWSSLRVYHKAHMKQALRRLHQGIRHNSGKAPVSTSLLRKHSLSRRRSHDWSALPWPADMQQPSPKRPRENEPFFDNLNRPSHFSGVVSPTTAPATSQETEHTDYICPRSHPLDEITSGHDEVGHSVTMDMPGSHASLHSEEEIKITEFPLSSAQSAATTVGETTSVESLLQQGDNADHIFSPGNSLNIPGSP